MATLNLKDFEDKVLACWLGKNIGGTLGAPMEWKRQVNDVTFYTQELGGEPLPNDDLDIQLLWLMAMERHGVDIDAHTLADWWVKHVTPHWAEYGTGKINMMSGLQPPVCGEYGNLYKHSCGAFIRSEIWACVFAGRPAEAAAKAYEDAILDHGGGEGTYAAVFCAALESAAFVLSDLRQLIDIGLSYIPAECGTARAVRTALDCIDRGVEWREARDEILHHHRGKVFMNNYYHISKEDLEKGFDSGELGYDAPSNIAILVYGLLYGGDNFDKMICTTVNMGEDTDCTAATAGALYGIIHGTAAIPEKWIDPIGHGIKTIAVNRGDCGGLPGNVDDLTSRTVRLARQAALRQRWCPVVLSESGETNLDGITPDTLSAADHGAWLYTCLRGPRFRFDFFTIELDLGEAPVVCAGVEKEVAVTIRNHDVQANLHLRWILPEGWDVRPGRETTYHSIQPRLGGEETAIPFSITPAAVSPGANRLVLEITTPGRPVAMLAPVVLLGSPVA